MDDFTQDLILVGQLDFFLAYTLMVVLPTLVNNNWVRVWREMRTDLELFFWLKLYPKIFRDNLFQ